MKNEITIILLSHKSKDLIVNIIKDIYTKFQVLVIDNSNEISLKNVIENKFPTVIYRTIENNGYGAAVNYGSKLVKTKYFLISNPDIEGLNEKNIIEFIKAAKNLNDNFSSLGPRFIDADLKSHIQSNENIDIAEMRFLSGACMFFKTETFNLLGGFDENFFLYFEESDLCLRAHKIKKNYQINKIKIKHNTGSSVKVDNKKDQRELQKLYNWHFIWSKFYYYKKNYGYSYSLIYFFPIIIRTIIKLIFYTIFKNNEKKENYSVRLNGLLRSMRGLNSSRRLN